MRAQPKPEPKAVEGLEECKPQPAGVAAGTAVSGTFGEGEGRVWLWGFGGSNQLGNGDDDSDLPRPERIKESKNFNMKKVRGGRPDSECGGPCAL